MSAPKNAGYSGLKQDPGKSPSKLRETGGYSLVEIMISLGVGLVVMLAMTAIFVFGMQQFTLLVEKNEAEEQVLWASYHLRYFLMQAIDLQAVPNNGVIGNLIGPNGLVRDGYDNCGGPNDCGAAGNSGQLASNRSVDALAVFYREVGIPEANQLQAGRLAATGIFFQRPGLGQEQWGRLVIDPGDANVVGGGFPVNNASNGLVYDRLTRVKVDVICLVEPCQNIAGGDPDGLKAKEATITITARYFRNAQKRLWVYAWEWIALGGQLQAYRDITVEVHVGFRNNALRKSMLGDPNVNERLHGQLYYFQFIPPRVN